VNRSTCVLAGLVLLALPLRAQAPPEKSWSLEAGADWSSIYLFRGVDLLNDESVVAPRASLSWGGLAVSYYGYFGDLPGANRYVEGDLTADYTFEIGKAAVGGIRLRRRAEETASGRRIWPGSRSSATPGARRRGCSSPPWSPAGRIRRCVCARSWRSIRSTPSPVNGSTR
jgi:hypothetical protein